MVQDYILERANGDEIIFIHAADLYLVDQWNADSTVSDDDQRSAIFRRWIDGGWRVRLPYEKQLEEMNRAERDLTDCEKDLLTRVRHSDERKDAGPTRLIRTFYGPGSDETLSDLIEQAEFDGAVFDNAALYDYGADDGLLSLPSILVRIPQILEHTARFAFQHDEGKREALEEAHQIGPNGRDWDYAVAISHQHAKWTEMFIYDKEAHDSGDVLLVYTDDRGRVLRYDRLIGEEDLNAAYAMVLTGQDTMHRWWEGGDFGEAWQPERLEERWLELQRESSEVSDE